MTPLAPTEREQADHYVGLVRDALTIDQLVHAAQAAHRQGLHELESDLHRWIGERYAALRSATTTDTPYSVERAS